MNKKCGDCEYFVAFRNMNYETCTNDTITEYCDLLQNKETYDRDKGDEVWNSIFQDCPLQTGIIPVKSAIKLLESRKFEAEQFNDYVRHSCKETEQLKNENEQLREQNNKYVIMMNSNAHLNEMLKEENEQLKKDNEKLQELVDVSMKADEVFSVFDDLKYIESALTFLIDNGLEDQCVEYEREDIHFVAERLRIVLRSLDDE